MRSSLLFNLAFAFCVLARPSPANEPRQVKSPRPNMVEAAPSPGPAQVMTPNMGQLKQVVQPVQMPAMNPQPRPNAMPAMQNPGPGPNAMPAMQKPGSGPNSPGKNLMNGMLGMGG